MYQSSNQHLRGGNLPFPSSAPALPAHGRRCCSRRPATPSRCMSAATQAMMLSTSHWAGGMLAPYCESEVAEPDHQPARPARARSVAQGIAGHPVQRLAGGGACARPQRFRTLRRLTSGHRRLDARGARRTRTLAGGPFPRRRCSSPMKAMSSRAACCRNCTSGSSPPAAPSSSTANRRPTISRAS